MSALIAVSTSAAVTIWQRFRGHIIPTTPYYLLPHYSSPISSLFSRGKNNNCRWGKGSIAKKILPVSSATRHSVFEIVVFKLRLEMGADIDLDSISWRRVYTSLAFRLCGEPTLRKLSTHNFQASPGLDRIKTNNRETLFPALWVA